MPKLLKLSSLAWLAACCSPALAAVDSDGADEIETVIVTAAKVARDAQDVPVALTTIDGDFIRESGLASFNDLQNYAANLNITVAGSSGTLGVRGFATPDTNPSFDPSVGTVVDGVFYGRSAFLSVFFADLARFEVLRGPQGTLFGKNTSAGLLNLTTNDGHNGAPTILDVRGSDYGRRSLQPAVTIGADDEWALRLSANATYGDEGSQYNTALQRPESDPSQRTVRLRLGYRGDSQWRADIGAFYSRQWRNYNLFALDQVQPNMLALIKTYDPLAETDPSNRTNSANNPSRDDSELYGANLSLDYEADPFWGMKRSTFSSVTAYAASRDRRGDLDADFSPVPFIVNKLVEPARYQQLSQELRLAGESDDLFGWGYGVNFVTGLYVFGSRFQTSDLFVVEDLGAALSYIAAAQSDANDDVPLLGGVISGLGGALGPPLGQLITQLSPLTNTLLGEQSAAVGLDQKTQSYAYFGQVEHYFLQHWAIFGGLRFGYEKKTGDAYSRSNSPLIPIITAGAQADHESHLSRSEWDLSPKAGFKWEPTQNLTSYISWAQGYKSGGFNGLPLSDANLEYDRELASSYEIGAKLRGRVFDTPAQLNVAAFNTDFDDLQVSTFRDGNFVILNAASARSRGVEADITWLPVNGLLLSSSVGYARANYRNYDDAPAISGSGEDSQSLSGRPLQLAPRWTASFVPAYLLPLPGPLHVTLAGDVLYRSSRFLDVDDDPAKRHAATQVYNARLSVGAANDRWTLILAGNNLSAETTYNQALSQPLAPGNTVRWRTDYGRFYTVNLAVQL